MSVIFFFLASIGALAAAVAVISLRNPFYSVLALVAHLICLALLFMLLHAEFVAAAQVVVYAGAVMVLYVFVVAYIGGAEDLSLTSGASRVLGPLFALAIVVELMIALLGTGLAAIGHKGAHYVQGYGTPGHLGKLLLVSYLFPFEAASLLLLVAAVGAVVLARRRLGESDVDPRIEGIAGEHRPTFTGTLAEGVGVRSIYEAIEAAEARRTKLAEGNREGGLAEPDSEYQEHAHVGAGAAENSDDGEAKQ